MSIFVTFVSGMFAKAKWIEVMSDLVVLKLSQMCVTDLKVF